MLQKCDALPRQQASGLRDCQSTDYSTQIEQIVLPSLQTSQHMR